MNIGNPYPLRTPDEVMRELARKTRQLRLLRKWKQATLATRSGVTLASLRRFERSGEISLKSLLRLSFALGRLDDFDALLRQPEAGSIRELEALALQPKSKRGTQ
ncbi:MAG: helix-turn-helix domain-containing protein [bacterium]